MIKKSFVMFVILLMAFSSIVVAQDAAPAESPPAESPPVEAPPAEAPPVEVPTVPAGVPGSLDTPVTDDGQPIGEQPPMPPQQPMPPSGEPQQPPMQPPQGPGMGGCWVGNQQVPCPTNEPRPEIREPNIPVGCKQINDNGMMRIVCDNMARPQDPIACTPGPEREKIEAKCKETGGNIVTRNMDPSKGCGIVDCVYGQPTAGPSFMPSQQNQCPGPDELAKKEESCRSMGMNPVRMRSSCEYVQCEDPNKQKSMCQDNYEEKIKVKDECVQGRIVEEFDSMGCSHPRCISSEQECTRDVPQEAYFKCEDQGGKLVLNSDEQGCITFSKCVRRGTGAVEAVDIDEVPPVAKLLSVALKLESIKISFDQMSKQIKGIADYYENEGDDANAERFRRAAAMFESAKKQIDEVRNELRMGVKGMSVEQIVDIKYKIKQISEVVMEDALYVILGGEASDIAEPVEYERSAEEAETYAESRMNCGDDGMCFNKAVRICQKGVKLSPDSNTEMQIVGLKGESCLINGFLKSPEGMLDMECEFADYATEALQQESFLTNCKGSMIDYAKKQFAGSTSQSGLAQRKTLNREDAFQGQMMGCEKVDKGINKQGVCGNECCEERFGESYSNCPSDCMGPRQGIVERVMRTEQAPRVERQTMETNRIDGPLPGSQDSQRIEEPALQQGIIEPAVIQEPAVEPGQAAEPSPADIIEPVVIQEPAVEPGQAAEPSPADTSTADTSSSDGGMGMTTGDVVWDKLKVLLWR